MKSKINDPLSGFTIKGASNISGSNIPSIVLKIIEFLNKQNDTDLWPTKVLQLEPGFGSFSGHSTHPALADYRHMLGGNRTIWGSKKAIARLKDQLAAKKS